MKKILIVFLILFLGNNLINAQQLLQESFETDGEGSRYTSNTFYTACNDYFTRMDNTPATYCVTTHPTNPNGSFYWGSEDSDQASGGEGVITFNSLTVTGLSLDVDVLLAVGRPNDFRLEATDYFIMEYNMDSAGWNIFGAFYGNSSNLQEDTDLNGSFNAGATEITSSNFTNVNFTIPVTGNSIQVRIRALSNTGTEEIIFDNIRINGTTASVQPTVNTTAASTIANTSATLAGNVTADGGASITERGVVYSKTATNSNPTIGGTGVTKNTNGTGTGVFSESIALISGTQYSFKAYAINPVGTSYGAVQTFTTTTPSTPPTISFSNTIKTYGGANFPVVATSNSSGAISYSIVGSANGTSLSGTNNATVTLGNVGTVTIRATQAANGSYTSGTKDMILTITKAALTVTAEAKSKVYGAANPTLTASYVGFVNNDTAASLDTAVSLSTTAVMGSDVGSYPITASAAADANYTVTFAVGSLTVTKAALTVTAEAKSKVYGAANPTLTASYAGFVNNDTTASLDTAVSLSTTAVIGSDVGSYPITASAAADANYTVTFTVGSLTVTKAALTVTAEAKSKVYGAANPTLTASYAGFVNNDTTASLDTAVSLSTTAVMGSDVGSYPITASAAADANYTVTFTVGSLTVTKAALTVTAEAKSKVYGAANPTLTASYVGFVNNDTAASLDTAVSLSTTAVMGSDVGSYPITASAAADANYTVTFAVGSLTVTKAALTVTAEAKSKVYGAANPTLTASYAGFVNNDTTASLDTAVSLSTTAVIGSDVGSYPITASAAADANYTVTFTAGSLTVTKAALTVTAEAKSKVYGAANPTLTASYAGFVNNDTTASLDTAVSLSTTAVMGSDVGSYPITASAAADANYTVTFTVGSLTVTKAALTVTAEAKSKVYGAANPTLTASYAGFVNNDTAASLDTAVSLSTTAVIGSDVGSYPITASAAADANYTVTFTAGSLTVTKAALTVTAEAKSKVYGAANPTLTASYAGFVNNDTAASLDTAVSLSTTAVMGSDVGSYPITASAAADANYTVTFTAGSLTVTKAALTVTAEAKSKVYGAANPTLTASYVGFVNNDTAASLDTAVSLSTTAVMGSDVGSYPITASAAADANYTVTFTAGSLTVTKAALTVTAEAKSKVYGAANPTLTASYVGFVNNDTAASLDTAVSLSTTAVMGSDVGSYPITASAAADANYTVTFAAGSLTVTKAALTVTAEAKSKVYGAANPTLTASYAGFVNNDTTASLDTAVSLSTTAVMGSDVGSYPITASAAADANYTVTFTVGSLTVTKAALTVTAEAKSKVYGAANPTLTASYAGFVNNDTTASLDTAVSLSTTAVMGSDVGSYPITASAAADANYTVTFTVGSLTVTKAALTVTAEAKSKVYGAANPTLTASYTGFVNNDTAASLDTAVSLSTTAVMGSDVGSYPITASAAADANYTVTFAVGSLTVTKAALTVTAEAKSKVYGTANPTLTASYTGFVNNDTAASLDTAVSLSTTAVMGSDVGSYPITASAAADANYTVTFTAGSLTVTKAALTVTAEAKSKVYGAANPTLTASYVGFVNNDTAASLDTAVSLSTTAVMGSDVGSYPITASAAADANYTVTFTVGSLTVTKAALTVTAEAKSKVYGAANPTLTASYAGFVNNDTAASLDTAVSLSTTAVIGSDVGSYPITASAAADANYTVTFTVGSLTVTKADLTVTAEAKSKVYGAANPTLTASYAGFVNNDTAASLDTAVSLSTTAVIGSDVGSYPITASAAADANYTVTFAAGSLTVTKAALTVTADAKSKVYGATDPTLTYTITGFVNGDVETDLDTQVSIARASGENVGNYTITPADAADANYTVGFVTADFSITAAALTVTADAGQTKVYGATEPTLTYTITGFVNGDVETNLDTAVSIARAAGENVGNYTITPADAADANYTVSFVTADFMIVSSAALTEVVEDIAGNANGLGVTADQLNSLPGVSGAVAGVDYTTALGNGTYADPNNPTAEEIQAVIDTVNSSTSRATKYGFSPNGDGINDTWKIDYISLYPNNSVKVFNRSGKLVFEQKGYNNTWNGVSNKAGANRRLPVGPYLFTIDLNNGENLIKGWLYINY